MRLIPAGFFPLDMSATRMQEREEANSTIPKVTISTPFYISATEISGRQWERVLHPDSENGDTTGRDVPISSVSWQECVDFCRALCRLEGVSEGTYRLLSEAEWEYVCRAGTKSKYCTGDEVVELARSGWTGTDSGGKKHPSAKKEPNAWGVYDMHGNVAEWCLDWFGAYSHAGKSTDPTGPDTGAYRIVRGGSWRQNAEAACSSARGRLEPVSRSPSIGLRIRRTAPLNSHGPAPSGL